MLNSIHHRESRIENEAAALHSGPRRCIWALHSRKRFSMLNAIHIPSHPCIPSMLNSIHHHTIHHRESRIEYEAAGLHSGLHSGAENAPQSLISAFCGFKRYLSHPRKENAIAGLQTTLKRKLIEHLASRIENEA